ncbi:MAG: hypothetical protein MUF34_02950 [Polyangiaceae bacterium]|nr:hypothetical protein [Polyangiaceae bacterium]
MAWVDADDRLHPDKLRAQLEALAPAGDAAAVASSDVVIERHRPGAPPLGLFSLWPAGDELLEALCGQRGVPPVGYLLTRAAVERLAATGGFLPVRCQDREYFNRAHLLGIPFYHVERALAVYRNWSDRQVTNTLDPLLWSPAFAACFASLRAVAEREGRPLSARQRITLERPWAPPRGPSRTPRSSPPAPVKRRPRSPPSSTGCSRRSPSSWTPARSSRSTKPKPALGSNSARRSAVREPVASAHDGALAVDEGVLTGEADLTVRSDGALWIDIVTGRRRPVYPAP